MLIQQHFIFFVYLLYLGIKFGGFLDHLSLLSYVAEITHVFAVTVAVEDLRDCGWRRVLGFSDRWWEDWWRKDWWWEVLVSAYLVSILVGSVGMLNFGGVFVGYRRWFNFNLIFHLIGKIWITLMRTHRLFSFKTLSKIRFYDFPSIKNPEK
jgi:hypothetical protein